MPDERSGWARLWSALTAPPSRRQVIAAVLLGLLGYAGTVQIELTRTSTDFAGQRRGDLVALLDSLSGAGDRAQSQISELQQTRDQLQSSSQARAVALREARTRLTDLQILAGTIPAEGPGVTIRVDDPAGTVTAAVLLDGIEELRDAGAEALEINERVRIVGSSWIGGEPGALVVDGVALRPPYEVTAIGSAHTLRNAIGFPGGFADEVRALGGTVSVTERDLVRITALHAMQARQYSRPTAP